MKRRTFLAGIAALFALPRAKHRRRNKPYIAESGPEDCPPEGWERRRELKVLGPPQRRYIDLCGWESVTQFSGDRKRKGVPGPNGTVIWSDWMPV